jgi:hypothetical protein
MSVSNREAASMELKPEIRRVADFALRMPIIRGILQRTAAFGLRIPPIREYAARELTANLRVIGDLGITRNDYPLSEQWATERNPTLRALLDEISDQIVVRAQEEIRDGLSLLRPYAVKGFQKIRFGSASDGGYVMLDDFRSVDTAFSFGIDKNAEWDLDVAKRGVTVYQFDHTVDKPPITDSRLVFTNKKISTECGPNSESLFSLLQRHDKHDIEPNILLKLDIECDEWAIFDRAPREVLTRFSQIVGEFHFFEGYSADIRWRRLITRVLKKLTNDYAVIHVHANNYGDFHALGSLTLPNVLEITFANRALYSFYRTDESFPGPLDAPNDPSRPDVHLDMFEGHPG